MTANTGCNTIVKVVAGDSVRGEFKKVDVASWEHMARAGQILRNQDFFNGLVDMASEVQPVMYVECDAHGGYHESRGTGQGESTCV